MPAGRRIRPELVWLGTWLQLARPATTLIHGALEPPELIQLAGMLRDAQARRVHHVRPLCGPDHGGPDHDDLVALGQAGLDWLVRQTAASALPAHALDLLIVAGSRPPAEALSALRFTPDALVIGLDTHAPPDDACLDWFGRCGGLDLEWVLRAPNGLNLWLARRRRNGGRSSHV
jgi:hypothetical protein